MPLVLLLGLGGCGYDVTGPAAAEFDELCGQNEPVKLLNLDPDRTLDHVTSRELGERLLLMLGYEDAESRELWSVGRCGEDPVLVSDSLHGWPRSYEPWPEILFYCDEADDLLWTLDPTGVHPPSPVFETRACFAKVTPAGLVTILGDGDTGPLVLQPWPEDPFTQAAEQVVLLDEVKAAALPFPHTQPDAHEVLDTVDNEVFAVTAADELVVLNLDDLVPTVLAQDVREFDVSQSEGGRWLVWQDIEVTKVGMYSGDSQWPEGPVYLLDRMSGEISQLDDTAMAYTLTSYMGAVEAGLLYYRVGAINDESAGRWVRLDTLEQYASPSTTASPYLVIDESRLLLSSVFFRPPFTVVDVSTGEHNTIFSDQMVRLRATTDSLIILRESGGELVKIDFEGNTRTLAKGVHELYQISEDEHVITPFAVGADGIGSLVIVEPETLDERYIDDDVLSKSSMIYETDDGLLVSYAVISSDPERHGIWLAKPGD
ncbi:hypothetical protein [Enhygromyxa salina]|uniref:hypothetical protein n=1 Tax=Enhygromyxa salina TaxID=215803 RepID=UPI000D09422D|nr:hypothetical protein [Enhygromyxa salina]